MKTPFEENHDLIRWLDGEMSPAERAAFEATLQNDPQLAAEAAEMQKLSLSLKEHLPAELPVPHADFFNSQIQVRIAQLELDDARAASQRGEGAIARFMQWLRTPWFFGAAATALLVAGFAWLQIGTASGTTAILSSYTPNPAVHAETYHSSEAQATVLMLEGLEPIPSNQPITGFHVHRAEPDAEMASTTLFDASGSVLLVMAKDARGQPQILK